MFSTNHVNLSLVTALLLLSSCGGGGTSDSETSENSNATDPSSASSTVENMGSADQAMSDEHGSSMEEDYGSMESEMAMMSEEAGLSGEDGSGDEYPENYGEPGSEEEMAAAYAEMGIGEGGPGPRGPRKPPRPEKIEEWTPEHVADGIRETDLKTIKAIELFAQSTKHRIDGVDQLKTWLAVLSEKPDPKQNNNGGGFTEESSFGESAMQDYAGDYGDDLGYGGGQQRGPSQQEQIVKALFDAFATNGTRGAYETLASVLSGQVTVGEDKNKPMELAFVTLMKNVSDPNNPAQAQLQQALSTVQLDSAPLPKEEKENPVASLQKQVKELHLSFAIAAMNGLIGSQGAPPPKGGNQYHANDSAYDSIEYGLGEAGMQPGGPGGEGGTQGPSTAQPVKLAPIDLKPDEAERTLPYFWSQEMVDYALKQLQQHPESTEALVFAAAFPMESTRLAVRQEFEKHRLDSPNHWLHETVLANQLADPAIHLLIKQFPREAPPQGQQGGGNGDYYGESGAPTNRRSNKKEEDPEAAKRKLAAYGWMRASEKTLVSLMQRMYEGSQKPGATPHDQSEIPLSLHKGAEVTASMRFALPEAIAANGNVVAPQKTIVNYVRIESNQMTQKTVLHYRNSMRDKTVVSILGGNGMWLDGPVKPYRKNNTIRSVDVLLSKGNVRPTFEERKGPPRQMTNEEAYAGEVEYGASGGYGGGPGGQNFVVEILTVEVPPEVTEEEEKVTSVN